MGALYQSITTPIKKLHWIENHLCGRKQTLLKSIKLLISTHIPHVLGICAPVKPAGASFKHVQMWPRLMLCDSADGSLQYGPFHKSMFNGMFFSRHHYPLCLLSSGCLMSAELVCTCHIEFMACNLSCTMGVAVSWELLFLFFPPYLTDIKDGCFWPRVKYCVPRFCNMFRVQMCLPEPLPAHEQFENLLVQDAFF